MTIKKPRLSNDEIKEQRNKTLLFIESTSKYTLDKSKLIEKIINKLKVPSGTDLSKREIQCIEAKINQLKIINRKLKLKMECLESHLALLLKSRC